MDIKDYRNKELTAYVLGISLVILNIEGIWSFGDLNLEMVQLSSMVVELILSTSVMTIFVMIADSVIDNRGKEKIVFWQKSMPGTTVFTDIKNEKVKDERFTREAVHDQYSEIYKSLDSISSEKERKNQENAAWYIIYKKHKTEKMIEVSNRDYLLCRDLTSINIIMMIVYLVLSIALQMFEVKYKVIGFLCLMYFILMIASRLKARRFVLNVIAADVKY